MLWYTLIADLIRAVCTSGPYAPSYIGLLGLLVRRSEIPLCSTSFYLAKGSNTNTKTHYIRVAGRAVV